MSAGVAGCNMRAGARTWRHALLVMLVISSMAMPCAMAHGTSLGSSGPGGSGGVALCAAAAAAAGGFALVSVRAATDDRAGRVCAAFVRRCAVAAATGAADPTPRSVLPGAYAARPHVCPTCCTCVLLCSQASNDLSRVPSASPQSIADPTRMEVATVHEDEVAGAAGLMQVAQRLTDARNDGDAEMARRTGHIDLSLDSLTGSGRFLCRVRADDSNQARLEAKYIRFVNMHYWVLVCRHGVAVVTADFQVRFICAQSWGRLLLLWAGPHEHCGCLCCRCVDAA